MNSPHTDKGTRPFASDTISAVPNERSLFDSRSFRRVISLERKRSERSRKPFLLMLLDFGDDHCCQSGTTIEQDLLRMICGTTRETDVAGWYKDRSILGIIFTELGDKESSLTFTYLTARVAEAVHRYFPAEEYGRVGISCHVFPEDWENGKQPPTDLNLYPDLVDRESSRRSLRIVKRFVDVIGSVAAIFLLSPVFVLIAVAIKASSKGSVFYRQLRLGQYGATFPMLKFRSMYTGSDSAPHQEYVRQFITGEAQRNPGKTERDSVFKLTNDERITPVGAFLRRTSLDELPQLLNVLRGEMSLVGPRPPIDYELDTYQLWHRRRLMEAKPGITGLWQVSGRNRIPFDEMVRLDLAYARSWSPWLDLEILLRTPAAVVEGAH